MDVGLAHLDRPFDYLVPAHLDADARPGVRVRVRFAGQLVDGYLLERVARSEHGGRLTYLDRVVSPEPVLAPEVARLARAIADRYAGTLSDVLRLAVPPRHARAEAASPAVPAATGGATSAAPGGGPDGGPDSGGPAGGSDGGGPAGGGGSDGGPDGGSAGPEDSAAGEGTPGQQDDRTPEPADGQTGSSAGAGAGGEAAGGGAGAGGEAASSDAGAGGQAGGSDAGGSAGAGVGGDGVAGGGFDPRRWRNYPTGPGFVSALADGRAPRAVWTALPGEDWPARIAEAVAATVHSGRGAVVAVADARDLDRLDAALASCLGPDRHVALSAAVGPAERYRRFLAARRGRVRAVIGTRAVVFAPVADLGLVAIWDDGDDSYSEPRAPYPHAREVLLTRAQLGGAAVLLGGYARSAEAQQLLETGWAKPIEAARDTLRRYAPSVHATSDDPRDQAAARLPTLAWRAARDALAAGAPVLVQVPRRGYLPAVACANCRTPARCPHCQGPLSLTGSASTAVCRWCGRAAAGYACPVCGGRRLRAAVVGARRTAEELGRAFPDVPVWTSGRDGVLAGVPDEPGLAVSTPGAEPVPAGPGYGAVLLLDTWALLTRADLRAGEEALRRWLAAAALARPGAAGGRVVVVADGGLAPVQALIRFDPGWLAARELAERRELGFPPTVRMASLTGTTEAVADLLSAAHLPDGVEPLGPVPAGDGQERMLLRTTRSGGTALAAALREAAGVRSARKAPDPVRLQVDPLQLL
ncbi:primosomal protein N' [Rugosimonospora africana]|uniref:primosomal protein N' n=1 Tax=Rugosimonospora africana TaxID=556532 RepID=UPI004032D085